MDDRFSLNTDGVRIGANPNDGCNLPAPMILYAIAFEGALMTHSPNSLATVYARFEFNDEAVNG